MMSSEAAATDGAKSVRDQVAGLIAGEKLDDDWLRAIHSAYVARYVTDNERTWSTATWLVALAWTLFPAAVALQENLSLVVLIVFGLTSTALTLLWIAIATAHRAWASRSYDIVRAIEKLLLPRSDNKIREILMAEHEVPRVLGGDPMSTVRWAIVLGTPLAWIVLGLLIYLVPDVNPWPTP